MNPNHLQAKNTLAKQLEEAGFLAGPVYATGVLKGRDVSRMTADFRAQESIRSMTSGILKEAGLKLKSRGFS